MSTLELPINCTRFSLNLFLNLSLEVDLKGSITKRLPKADEITHEKAIQVLKYIKIKSDVLSFLTKPIVVISLGTVVMLAGISFSLLTTASIAFGILGIVLGGIGGGLIGFGIENGFLNDNLSQLSLAYAKQSQEAERLITTIEKDQNKNLINFQ